MATRTEIHERVLNATSKEELSKAYNEWADAYDDDLINKMGYIAHQSAVNLLQERITASEQRILDAGCGTGLVGETLYQKGYRNIDGLDYSKDMLAKAAEKSVYQSLKQGDLTSRLDLADDIYDAVISVGTFTCGHVGPDSLGELIRVTRPGGYICFTVRDEAWEGDNYLDKIGEMERKGMWTLIEKQNSDYIRQEGSLCMICLYRVNG